MNGRLKNCVLDFDKQTKRKEQKNDRLKQSILAKAFRDELVPQDEGDEPASVLLERIRVEKTENNSGNNHKPKRKAVNQSKLFE
jgi:type I restriction enzyme S subunit